MASLKDLIVTGPTRLIGKAFLANSITAASFIKSGGTSAQFLKADGSVDSNSYLTVASASNTYLPLVGGTVTGNVLFEADVDVEGILTTQAPALGDTPSIFCKGSTGVWTKARISNGSAFWDICTKTSDTNGALQLLYNGGVTGRVIIASNGYVGVNNMPPSYPLDVNGTIRSTGQVISSNGFVKYTYDNNYMLLAGGGTALTANYDNMQEITHANLLSLKNSGKLIPGKFYRITDYDTVSNLQSTRVKNHPFDIIVRADSNSKLNENAWAAQSARDSGKYFSNSNLAAWKLKYTVDNDPHYIWSIDKPYYCVEDTFIGLLEWDGAEPVYNDNLDEDVTVYHLIDDPSTYIYYGEASGEFYDDEYNALYVSTYTPYTHYAPKGIIYFMEDEFGNEAPYDFKNIQFLMNVNTAQPATSTSSTSFYFYTFPNVTQSSPYDSDYSVINKSRQNKIRNLNWKSAKYFTLPFIVIGESHGNVFGVGCQRIMVQGNGNVFGAACSNINLKKPCVHNTFNTACNNITLYDHCYDNYFETQSSQITLEAYSCNNVFGNYKTNGCSYIWLPANSCGNTFLGNNSGIIFTNSTAGTYSTINTTYSSNKRSANNCKIAPNIKYMNISCYSGVSTAIRDITINESVSVKNGTSGSYKVLYVCKNGASSYGLGTTSTNNVAREYDCVEQQLRVSAMDSGSAYKKCYTIT